MTLRVEFRLGVFVLDVCEYLGLLDVGDARHELNVALAFWSGWGSWGLGVGLVLWFARRE
ncbi:MAG: hypothetical protein LBL41_03695 [Bifidobacteriaceae bacterium]|nr:hypothetical protein [Bifidobacteriaceae bacterium]